MLNHLKYLGLSWLPRVVQIPPGSLVLLVIIATFVYAPARDQLQNPRCFYHRRRGGDLFFNSGFFM
jgi:hypothetical protein